jgi:hypothetical protein
MWYMFVSHVAVLNTRNMWCRTYLRTSKATPTTP